MSCATGNYCVAVGETSTDQFSDRATVDVDLFGTWQQAMIVPGLGMSSSQALSVSCASVGNCTVAGWYRDASNARQAFVEDEVNGNWGSFRPLAADLNTGQFAELNSVSCESPQNCTAVGEYATVGGTPHAFLVAEVSGTWRLPGPLIFVLPPSTGRAVSCPAFGNCELTGTDADVNGQIQAYAQQTNSGGQEAIQFLTSSTVLNVGGTALTNSVSCASDGNCAIGGVVATSTGLQAIVSMESPAASATLAANTATVQFGHEQSAQLVINVKPKTGGTPKGNVTISAGQTTLAVVTLKRGKATWTFPPKELRPGTYQLTASYASSNGYDPVTSARKRFVVTR